MSDEVKEIEVFESRRFSKALSKLSDQQLKVLTPLAESEIYGDDTNRLKELILQFDSDNAVVVIDKLIKSIKAFS